MSELNEGIRVKSWKEWRQGITNAKNRIGAFFKGLPQPTGEVTPEITAAQEKRDKERLNKPVVVNKNNNKPVVVNQNNNKPVVVNQNQIKKNDADKQRLKDNPSKFFGTNQYGEGGSQIKGGPVVKKPVSQEIKKQDTQIKKVQPVKTNDYLGKSQGLLGKDAWLHKTRNSPAARSGAFTGDERWNTQLKHRQWQKDNNRGAFRVQKVNTPKIQTQEYELDAYDLVLEHLIATQQADTIKEAHYVMMEMDADIIKAIVDEAKVYDVKYGKGNTKEKQKDQTKDVHLLHANPGVRQDRNKRLSPSDVIFRGHSTVERQRKQKHYKSRGVKKERGSKD